MFMYTNKIETALAFAGEAHKGITRKRLSYNVICPFIVHPVEVFKLVWTWGTVDDTIAVAALLHDTVEDTHVQLQEVEQKFGLAVANIVAELTLRKDMDKQAYLDDFKNKSVEALVIKFADRICNVRDFGIYDRVYAKKYLAKADNLFQNIIDRFPELEKRFGEKPAWNIERDISRLYGDFND